MNEFQIIGKSDQPLTLAALDSQASGFWKTDPDSKYYAEPNTNSLGNWFDTIGWGIANHPHKGHGKNNWKSVKQQMFEVHTYSFVELSPEEAGVRCCQLFRTLKPYFDLIDHWKSLGYTPKQITN